jgi:lambda family phage minor tail protein L
MTLELDVQQGWHDAIVEMFDIDLEPITGDPNDKFYFTNQLKPDDTKIQWKGNIYEPLPILSSGYEKNTTGQIAQPSLTVANIMGTFTDVIDSLDDLVGGKVTRRRTFGKYLDGEPQADTTQEFPIDIYYLERKASENALSITWQLASILDLEGLQLPRRIITQNYCQWRYRSSECGYTGAPTIGADDKTISSGGQSPEAIAVLNAAALEKQRTLELQNAINTRNAAAANKEASCSSDTLLETRFNSPSMAGVNYYVLVDRLGVYAFGGTNGIAAVWSGSTVTLGTTYRQGANEGGNYYSIERRGSSAGACTAATTALSIAESGTTAASAALLTAQAALGVALAALPSDDPLRQQDICGKRVASCQAHFPAVWNDATKVFEDQSLPFGGFPGAIQGRQ